MHDGIRKDMALCVLLEMRDVTLSMAFKWICIQQVGFDRGYEGQGSCFMGDVIAGWGGLSQVCSGKPGPRREELCVVGRMVQQLGTLASISEHLTGVSYPPITADREQPTPTSSCRGTYLHVAHSINSATHKSNQSFCLCLVFETGFFCIALAVLELRHLPNFASQC